MSDMPVLLRGMTRKHPVEGFDYRLYLRAQHLGIVS